FAPKKGFIWDTLACAYYKLGDIQAAWKCFQEMKRVDPKEKGTKEIHDTVAKLMKPHVMNTHKRKRPVQGGKEEEFQVISQEWTPGAKFVVFILLVIGIIFLIHDIIIGSYVISSFFRTIFYLPL
ncbi:MAG: pentatricopeptide repeat-containing protein, partial [Candidatus Helarchaeales archaeon]